MTAPDMSPTHQQPIGSFGEGIDNQIGMNHPGAHYTDDTHIGRILNPGHTGQIGPGVGAPVATKGDNQRFVLFVHFQDPRSGTRKPGNPFKLAAAGEPFYIISGNKG